jgi:hypothetical protein
MHTSHRTKKDRERERETYCCNNNGNKIRGLEEENYAHTRALGVDDDDDVAAHFFITIHLYR